MASMRHAQNSGHLEKLLTGGTAWCLLVFPRDSNSMRAGPGPPTPPDPRAYAKPGLQGLLGQHL